MSKKKRNIIIAVAIFFLIGGIGNLIEEPGYGIFGIVVASALIWYLKKNWKTVSKTSNYVIRFDVATWGKMLENLKQYQRTNSKDQWVDGKYSSKPLYQYSFLRIPNNVRLVAEPQNSADKFAIAIYIDNYHVGYVPQPINEENYKKLLQGQILEANIFGGDSKNIDSYGDLIVSRNNPKMSIQIEI